MALSSALHKWRLEDPADPDPATRVYVFPRNPVKMSAPFLEKNISMEGTTAVDGQVLLWEGVTPARPWSFGGAIIDKAQHEALRSWVYDRQGRLFVYDHFGRRFTVVMQALETEVVRKNQVYWRHDYTVKCIQIGQPTLPTVGEDGL